jgi:hypothetical protein
VVRREASDLPFDLEVRRDGQVLHLVLLAPDGPWEDLLRRVDR